MNYLNSRTMICRIGYCENCAKENRPHTGQTFLTVGKQGYHVYVAQRIGTWYGFTPHLYRIHKIIGQNVVYDMCCCMYNCGVTRRRNIPDQCWDYYPIENQWRRGIILLKDWNALLKYTRDWNYII